MKITHKILLGFILSVSLAVLICIGGLLNLKKMSDHYDRQLVVNGPTIEALHEILVAGLRIVATTAEIVMLQEHVQYDLDLKKNILKEEIEELRGGYREISDYHEKYYELIYKYFPDKVEQLEEVGAVLDRLVNSSTRLIEFERYDNRYELMEFEEELEEADDVFIKSLNRIILSAEKELAAEQAALIASGGITGKLLLSLTLLAVLGAFCSVFMILKPFKSGMAELSKVSEQVAGGDFNLNFTEDRKDEFGILASDFKKMAGEISTARNLADWSLLKIEKNAADLLAKNREYEEFVFVASHDLQEPLRKILTYASRLRKGIAGRVDEEYEQFATKIIESSTYLREKLDILSEYSRINVSGEGFSKVRLNEIICKVANRFQKIIGVEEATLTLKNLPEIDGKADQLEKLFHCLLDNSYKFRSDAPLEIKVSADVIEKENYCRIIVADNGEGFEQKYAGKIFRVFHSLDNRKFGGLGMGLAIVRKIVEVHGGSINVESSPGKGAKFIIVFPISQTGRHGNFNRKAGR